MVLAGIAGGVACREGATARTSVASEAAATQALAAPSGPGPTKPECIQCAIEDSRQVAHKDQVVVTARYLGLKERRTERGHRTSGRCTRDGEVMGVLRFALIGENPWLDPLLAPPTRRDPPKIIEVSLPCPELSRPQYAEMYRYDPDDTERDGLGHAPVLRRGELYRLTFVRNVKDLGRETDGRLALPMVAVNPR